MKSIVGCGSGASSKSPELILSPLTKTTSSVRIYLSGSLHCGKEAVLKLL